MSSLEKRKKRKKTREKRKERRLYIKNKRVLPS